MFSYRHAFHAGNHADVLKHVMLIATLRYMTQKETALHVIDTHAGAGLYRLDSDKASASGEAVGGILKLTDITNPSELLADYLQLVQQFNAPGAWGVYPGSPMIAHALLRPHDKLHCFELHSTDMPLLRSNLRQADEHKQTTLHLTDGFGATRSLLPPVSRRGLIVIDPSYENKNDYGHVVQCVGDGLERFATGTYLVWYPILPRVDASELPRRLERLAERTGRSWLNATLAVRGPNEEGPHRLAASGVVVINPPFTLRDSLNAALPQIAQALAQTSRANYSLDAGASK
jgi:23S rRNA (adenine2030-N6)-methyltransferase